MAIYALSNPTKEVTIKQPIEKIQASIREVVQAIINYTLLEEELITNRFRILVKESDAISKLSMDMGQHIDITLNEINENSTKVSLEIGRVVGVINQSYEANRATEALNTFLTYLSKSITGNLLEVVESHEVVEKKKNDADKQFSIFLWVVLIDILAFAAFKILQIRSERNTGSVRDHNQEIPVFAS